MLKELDVLFNDTPGVYNKHEVKLHINQTQTDRAWSNIPYALRAKVEKEIERLLVITSASAELGLLTGPRVEFSR